MSKKIVFAYLIVGLILVGCSKAPNNNQASTDIVNVVDKGNGTTDKVGEVEPDNQKEDKQEYPTVIKLTTEIGEPIGDRTADNVGQENGEYFAIGSDIVKCSDYDNIHVIAELTNTREELLKTAAIAWSAKMEDGYELELFQDGNGVGFMNDGSLGGQIQTGSTATFEFDILKKKDVKGNKIILTYKDVNYNDAYSKMITLAFSGSSEEECKKAYPDYFDESLNQEFEISLN